MRSALKGLWLLLLMGVVGVNVLASPPKAGAVRKRATTRAAAVPIPATVVEREKKQAESESVLQPTAGKPVEKRHGPPTQLRMSRGASKRFDLRTLPPIPPRERHLIEREPPPLQPVLIEPGGASSQRSPLEIAPRSTPAPATIMNFDGLDKVNWGAGFPPDTNGDAGPAHYIQSINTSIGIYRKSDGVRLAAFTFDTFMSQGDFGNPCDSDNMGDPVVLYDTFEDRWIITDFAFTVDGSGNVVNPPGAYQCIAVSMSGDPVSGGWNFYSINTAGGLGDYPKFGVWPDGLYLSVNMYDYAASGAYQGPRVYVFNKAQMYAGSPSVQVLAFDGPSNDFTLLPSNARLQTGTPPPGTPNYFVGTVLYLNALTVYELDVDWANVGLSTFSGPSIALAASSWPNQSVGTAATPGNSLDTISIRAMMQNQYSNIGGVESLWTTHTVRRALSGFAAPRWYQVDVTGGTVAPNVLQSTTWDPDGANVLYRYVPSLAVDRAGNMAIGYSASSSTTNPGIKYAGRLASDPANTFSQTEQVLIQGSGTQVGNCGGSPCTRWGDYAAMTLDPDGCTFWFTSEYYAVNGLDYLTRIGSFRYPECTQVGAGGTVSGTVTVSGGGALAGAVVQLGARSAVTNASGGYVFAGVPAGTYPLITAIYAGYVTGSASAIVVTDGGTTVQNFALSAAPASACPGDTSQADFQSGIANGVDLTTSPGNVILPVVEAIDQQQTAVVGGTGYSLSATVFVAQTFTPSLSGPLTKVEMNLFCSGCSGTTPDIPVLIQSTSGGAPSGVDLAAATITGFSGGQRWVTATFAAPFTVTAGTLYAVVLRPATDPSAGFGYAVGRGSGNVYANGVSYQNIGGTWYSQTNDLAFKVYLNTGYASSGDWTSTTKDSNPATGLLPVWSNLTWNGATPAGTQLRFQVAGSDSVAGPFSFVGPDGTAGTYFTSSPASLAAFHGDRYLQYRAYLSTGNSSVTPTLSDATLCYTNQVNAAPVLGAIGNRTVGESALLTFTISATDADGDAVTYSATGLPAGASLGAGTGVFAWTPSPGQFGTYEVTFTASDGLGGSDSETITITVTSPNPTNFTATATSATSVNLTWGPSTGAVTYEVFRRGAGGGYVSIGTTGSLAYTDTPVSAGTSYLYVVRGLEATGAPGPMSVPDLATTVIFSADPLPAGTIVRAVHFNELLVAVNAVRTLAGLPAAAFTDPVATGSVIRKSHVDQLRAALDAARSTLLIGAVTYTDPTVVRYSTSVKRAHVTELRSGVK